MSSTLFARLHRLACWLRGDTTAPAVHRLDALNQAARRPSFFNPAAMLREFFKLEAASGMLLLACAVLAMVVANSPWRDVYNTVLNHTTGVVGVGDFIIEKRLLLWVNDGLMAIFFFLIGLEIKREFIGGMLASWDQRILPGLAAFGGMLVPALIFTTYYLVNQPTAGAGAHEALQGWAIPCATDIAFALGLFALLGRSLPVSLKIFLLALAILDDLGAIVIIAVFYTADLHTVNLGLAGLCFACLLLFNILNFSRTSWYLVVGVIMWACVLKSGVHATLAGVVLAFTIPMHTHGERRSPLRQLEHDLHPFVAYVVLPLFAFANAGLYLGHITTSALFSPVTAGIVLGLFLGKQIGIFSAVWLAVKLGFARLPHQATWPQMWGVSLLAGVGFTMSLFIGGLAYASTGHQLETKLGVLLGSALSAIIALIVLWFSRNRPASATIPQQTTAEPAVNVAHR